MPPAPARDDEPDGYVVGEVSIDTDSGKVTYTDFDPPVEDVARVVAESGKKGTPGDRLRALRWQVLQLDLEEAAAICGVTITDLSRAELGHRADAPDAETMMDRLCRWWQRWTAEGRPGWRQPDRSPAGERDGEGATGVVDRCPSCGSSDAPGWIPEGSLNSRCTNRWHDRPAATGADSRNTYWLVETTCNHLPVWVMPDGRGWTPDASLAQRYSREEAEREAWHRNRSHGGPHSSDVRATEHMDLPPAATGADSGEGEVLARFTCMTVYPRQGGAPYGEMVAEGDGAWVSYSEAMRLLREARAANEAALAEAHAERVAALTAARDQHAVTVYQKQRAEHRASQWQAAADEARAALAAAQATIAELQGEVGHRDHVIDEQNAELDHLRATIAEREAEIARLTAEAQASNASACRWAADYSALLGIRDEQVAALKREHAQAVEAIIRDSHLCDDCSVNVQAVRARLAAKESAR